MKKPKVYFDRDENRFVGIEAVIEDLKEAYPLVCVDTELKKMALWLTSPRGSHHKGALTFVMSWLGRAKPSKTPEIINASEEPLRPFVGEYLKDLWKDKEELLNRNQK